MIVSELSDGPGELSGIAIGPDGRLAYGRGILVKDYTEVTFFVIPPGGGKPLTATKTRISMPQISSFRWTPDGKSFAYNDLRDGVGNIWTIPADGKGKERQLTNFSAPPPIVRFAWSKDSKQLFISRVVPTSDGILITDKGR